MGKQEIRIRVNDLLDSCSQCGNNEESKRGKAEKYCSGCSIFAELKKLRKPLDTNRSEWSEKILAKGTDMTTEEVKLLLEDGYNKTDIRKALGMNDTQFRNMLMDMGLAIERRKSKWQEVSNEMSLTVDEYIQLHYVDGKTPDEIGKMKGVTRQAVYGFRYYHKEKIEQALKEKGISEMRTKRAKNKDKLRTESVVKNVEVIEVPEEETIKKMERELSEAKKTLEEAKAEIEHLKDRLKKPTIDEFTFEKIRRENNILKELVKLWI